MEEVACLTQSPVSPSVEFTYTVLLLKAAGTYWCHVHTMDWEQVSRELYGPLIVQGRDGQSPCGDVIYWGETILLQEAAR